jgi:hypothetical protein
MLNTSISFASHPRLIPTPLMHHDRQRKDTHLAAIDHHPSITESSILVILQLSPIPLQLHGDTIHLVAVLWHYRAK